MPITKFLDPKNDFAFKRIFGAERNKDILIHFINDMLNFTGDHKIQAVQFLKTNQDPNIACKKQSLLDVLCSDEHGRQYIVEMQVARTPGFEKRAQYYAAKAYSKQLYQGEDYDQLKAIIFLAITDYIMFPNKKAYKSDHVVLDKVDHSHDLKDFSFTFLELPKFNKGIDELSNMIEKWTYFFKHAEQTHEKDLERIAGGDEIIERAYEELNRFSFSEIDMNTYEQEEKHERDNRSVMNYALNEARTTGLAQGIAEGMAQGVAQGVAQGKLEAIHDVAREMLAKRIDVSTIAACTHLSEEEIQALK
ncbi:MAG: Rpn family recombination-promoting nuclease/putative transposase [Gammaproteobacteria bacterium]|nr:Rpn family recombination-promoting nuclease/putative transposase [Gammaproteobacteria bacterium]